MKKPNIFISHQWKYNEEYYSIKRKFEELEWSHLDYSVPIHDPFDMNKKKLIEAALKEQVRQSNFFIVFARMASANSHWIQKEIEYALEYDKYILGVKPWDYQGNIPLFLQNACDDIVGFNTPAIIKRIELVLSY
jgi:MTH538 TIR-like domain (DUF1863)